MKLLVIASVVLRYSKWVTAWVDGSIAYPVIYGDGNSTFLNLKDVDGFSNGDMVVLFDGTQFIQTSKYDSTLLKSNKFATVLWAKAFRQASGISSTMLDVVVYNDAAIWVHGWMINSKLTSYIGQFDIDGNNVYSYTFGSPTFVNSWISLFKKLKFYIISKK